MGSTLDVGKNYLDLYKENKRQEALRNLHTRQEITALVVSELKDKITRKYTDPSTTLNDWDVRQDERYKTLPEKYKAQVDAHLQTCLQSQPAMDAKSAAHVRVEPAPAPAPAPSSSPSPS